MRMKMCAVLACLAAGALVVGDTAKAAPVTWTIVSSASTIKLSIPDGQTISATFAPVVGISSAVVTLRARNQTGATTGTGSSWTIGSTTNIEGDFLTDTDFTSSIEFLNSPFDDYDATISGSYNPQLGSPPPNNALTDPGDYGVRIIASVSLLGGLVKLNDPVFAALRDIMMQASSGAIAVTAGSFPASSMLVGVESGSLAYRGSGTLGGVVGSGLVALPSGTASNSKAGSGSIGIVGPLATLTYPVNAPLSFTLGPGLSFSANITGTIVATAIIPEPTTYALLGVGMAMLAPMAVRRYRKRRA